MNFDPNSSLRSTAFARAAEPDALSLGLLWRLVARRSGLLLLVVVAGVAIATLYLALTPPTFVSSAKLLIGSDRGLEDPSETREPIGNAQVESQVEILRASVIAREVTSREKLVADPEFNSAIAIPKWRAWIDSAATALAPHRRLAGALRDLSSRLSREPPRTSPEEAFAEAMASLSAHIGVRRLGQSDVIEIDVSADAPEKAARLATAVVNAYLSGVWRADAPAGAFRRFNDDIYKRSLAVTNARVISAPQPPLGKSSPQSFLVYAFAVTLSLFVGSAAAVWLEARRLAEPAPVPAAPLRGRDADRDELDYRIKDLAP